MNRACPVCGIPSERRGKGCPLPDVALCWYAKEINPVKPKPRTSVEPGPKTRVVSGSSDEAGPEYEKPPRDRNRKPSPLRKKDR